MVPSAMTSPNGLPAIRAATRPNQAQPEMMDKPRLSHKIVAERTLKAATVAPSRESAIRKLGEAMNKAKKTMPATITDEPKGISRTAINGLIKGSSKSNEIRCSGVTNPGEADQPPHLHPRRLSRSHAKSKAALGRVGIDRQNVPTDPVGSRSQLLQSDTHHAGADGRLA